MWSSIARDQSTMDTTLYKFGWNTIFLKFAKFLKNCFEVLTKFSFFLSRFCPGWKLGAGHRIKRIFPLGSKIQGIPGDINDLSRFPSQFTSQDHIRPGTHTLINLWPGFIHNLHNHNHPQPLPSSPCKKPPALCINFTTRWLCCKRGPFNLTAEAKLERLTTLLSAPVVSVQTIVTTVSTFFANSTGFVLMDQAQLVVCGNAMETRDA